LQSLYEGVLIVDRDQNILFMNKTLRDLTKERGSKVLHLRDLFREPEVLRTFVHAQDVGETQRVTLDLEIGDADSQHTFVLHVLPLKRLGIVNGVAGIFNEITELKMAEHFRTDLVANVSHEIRTPLTSLKGYAQALNSEIEKGSTETAKKYLDIMGRSMDRLNHLVSDLLDLSSLEGRAQLHIDESSTKELTDQVLTQLSQEIKTRGHVVNQHVAVPTLACDSIRVEQVLLNLLQNAVRYIPQGSQIDIFWESTKNGVLLKVKDNGPGISKEHLPRLFERFYRADKARSPDKGGTGLGLAIVKHIMQRHGGSVTVESTLGKGTTFTCWFPSQDH
jgi:two-component system phosphate regulon sensor histidine kinase PhoR